MACKTIPQELAAALGKTVVSSSDQLPIVSNDQLYRVTVGNLATSLGLTGAIISANAGGATPVLTGTAPNYIIRGILGGQGISAAVSPLGAVSINGQFNNAGSSVDGAGIIKDRTSSTIEMRRLFAGRGIAITQENNKIIIDNSQVDVSNRTAIITALADFPPASAGVITLAADTDYLISNSITTTNRFLTSNNTVIRSVDPRIVTLEYTGTGVMFTNGQGAFVLKEIALDCPNGTLINNNNTNGSFYIGYVIIREVANLGNLSKESVTIDNVLIELITGATGFVYLAQTNRRFSCRNLVINNATNAALDFVNFGTATFNNIDMTAIEVLASVSGQSLIKGVGAANLTADAYALINSITLIGGIAALDVVAYGNIGWEFNQVAGIPNTMPASQIFLAASAVVTIATIDAYVLASGTYTSNTADYFSNATGGRITYNGKRPLFCRLDTTCGLEPAANTDQAVKIAYFLNGTKIDASSVTSFISTELPSVVTLAWGVTLNAGDFIEVGFANGTSTANIELNQLLIRAS